MANNQQPLHERLRLASEQAAAGLAEIRGMDERSLTPRMLVRKARLLQLEDTPDGTPEEIEAALKAALDLDEQCIEAHIELGWYYYAVLDDSQRAKASFLKALALLSELNEEVIKGLLDCDGELQPDRDPINIKVGYQEKLLHKKE